MAVHWLHHFHDNSNGVDEDGNAAAYVWHHDEEIELKCHTASCRRLTIQSTVIPHMSQNQMIENHIQIAAQVRKTGCKEERSSA